LSIYDANDTPSAGFALESLAIYCGVERGPKWRPQLSPT
jgi:hypothetical protein